MKLAATRTLVVAAVATPLEASPAHLAATRGSGAPILVVGGRIVAPLLDDLKSVVCHIFVIFILLLVARWVSVAAIVVVVVVVLLVSASHVLNGRRHIALIARRDALSALRVVALQFSALVLGLLLVPIE